MSGVSAANRDGVGNRVSCQARYRETDHWIQAQRPLEGEAVAAVLNCCRQLKEYISHYPDFLPSLAPLPQNRFAPLLVRQMWRLRERLVQAPW